MKNIYAIILSVIFNSTFIISDSLSQTAPGIEWQNTIGGNANDYFMIIQQTFDGGYILGGPSQSNISGDKTENCIGIADYWIVKLDVAGNIQWQNTIGGNNYDPLSSIEQTSDGGYILGGSSNSNISDDKTENCLGFADYWVIKLDSSGTLQWQNTIGGSNSDNLYSIKQTTDGGYILGGFSSSNISGDKTENGLGYEDYWIVKLDSSGNIQWQNTIGGSDNETLYSIQQTTDGGYILGGFSDSDSSGDKIENNLDTTLATGDYWVVKLDSFGNIQWQNTIGGSDHEQLSSIYQTADNGFILGGHSDSNISGDKTENCIGGLDHTDYWVVKLDSTGNIQWQNTIGGTLYDYLLSIQQTGDGGYFLAGMSVSDVSVDKTENCLGGYDFWVIKIDLNGNIKWQNTIGGNSEDFLITSIQTNDGGYIFGGYSNSSLSGDKTENSQGGWDFWVVKLAPDTITGIPNIQIPNSQFQINPNPFVSQSRLTFRNPNREKFIFTLCDFTGKITETISTTSNEIILFKGNKQPGVYLFKLVNERTGDRWSGKVLITS